MVAAIVKDFIEDLTPPEEFAKRRDPSCQDCAAVV